MPWHLYPQLPVISVPAQRPTSTLLFLALTVPPTFPLPAHSQISIPFTTFQVGISSILQLFCPLHHYWSLTEVRRVLENDLPFLNCGLLTYWVHSHQEGEGLFFFWTWVLHDARTSNVVLPPHKSLQCCPYLTSLSDWSQINNCLELGPDVHL